VSAVGHEVDVTIADFVADARAATPSAAAELVVPVLEHLRRDLRELSAGMARALHRRARDGRRELDQVTRAMRSRSARVVERGRERLRAVAGRINVLSPLATLERGYALPRASDGTALSRAQQYAVGQRFELLLSDGIVGAATESVQLERKP
jgi:exodeoxyribonuclease VII large subunit